MKRGHLTRIAIIALAAGGAAPPAAAAEPGTPESAGGAGPAVVRGRPATVRRTAEPIKLDGKLDEAAWTTGLLPGDLMQYQPRAGQPMTEKTVLHLLYDRDQLYIGVRCFDREPGRITARGMERDGSVLSGDYVYFFFDTFHDGRNGYAFAVSPDEGRWDALVSNNFTVNRDWDGIWDVQCTTDEHGWVAEIRIPFKTVSFAPDRSTWGFNFSRWIARKGEGGRWVDPRPEVQTHFASNAGEITGLDGISRGLGLEFSPYALVRKRDEMYGENNLNFDAGFDLRYRITPSLNAIFSYNMDFAETEIDQRQINFSRFPLFFPEKRDFFLEDSGIYEVSGLGRDVFLPYYSRRIGLSGITNNRQEIVPITYAGKLSGRVGPYEIGITAAQLDTPDEIGVQNVLVARGARRIGEDSTLGFMATSGNPNSAGDNQIGGVDYSFQTSELFGDQTFAASVFAFGSTTDPVAEFPWLKSPPRSGHAFGAALSYPNDKYNFSIEAAEISAHFDPALGFLERSGVRRYASNWRYLWRPDDPKHIQWVSFIYANKIYTDLDNSLETGSHSFYPLVVRLGTNDELSFGITNTRDNLDGGFAIPSAPEPGRPVPGGSISFIGPGDYDMWNYTAKLTLSETRPFGGELGGEWGDFYGGKWVKLFGNLWWIPEKHVAIGVNYERYHFDMPDATIESDLVSAWLVLRFTPRARWSNWVQYDTLSDTLGWNSRFSWEVRPGQNLNLVLSQFYWNEREPFELLDTEIVAKGELTIRF